MSRRRFGSPALAAIAGLLAIAGCLRPAIREEAATQTASVPFLRYGISLAQLGIRRVAVIEPYDRTEQGGGLPTALALQGALERAGVPVHPDLVRRPGSALARTWLVGQARLLGADAFVSGTLSAFDIQEDQGRAYIAMTIILQDPAGRILWSHRVAAESPLVGRQATLTSGGHLGNNGAAVAEPTYDPAAVHRDALAAAALIAAKEFAHDLAPDPPH